MNVTYRIRLFTGFVITWATRRVTHAEQFLLTLPEHLRSTQVLGGVRVVYSLVLYVVSCVLLFVWLSVCLFIFSHVAVNLFSIYDFDCPSGIFRPSFISKLHLRYRLIISVLPIRISSTLDNLTVQLHLYIKRSAKSNSKYESIASQTFRKRFSKFTYGWLDISFTVHQNKIKIDMTMVTYSFSSYNFLPKQMIHRHGRQCYMSFFFVYLSLHRVYQWQLKKVSWNLTKPTVC